MGPTWSCRPQMGPMLAPWTLPSGYRGSFVCVVFFTLSSSHDAILLRTKKNTYIMLHKSKIYQGMELISGYSLPLKNVRYWLTLHWRSKIILRYQISSHNDKNQILCKKHFTSTQQHVLLKIPLDCRIKPPYHEVISSEIHPGTADKYIGEGP